MIHDYKTARSICSFVEFCGWAGVVVSGFIALAAIGTASSMRGGSLALVGLVPALELAIACFIVIVVVQMARATMDGSVAAQKNVIQNQKQHEELLRTIMSYGTRNRHGDQNQGGASLLDAGTRRPSSNVSRRRNSLEYKGQLIIEDDQSYRVHGISFATLDLAQRHIDNNTVGDVKTLVAEPLSETQVLYNGYVIETANNMFTVGGKSFGGMSLAKDHVDRLIARKNS